MSENPLTSEQLKKIDEISKLSIEEQKKVLPEFLKTLSPEQIEFLKKSSGSGPQCPFCQMSFGKIECFKVYESNSSFAVLDINPATKGHVILFPKTHASRLEEIKDVSDLFNSANKISSALIKSGAEGTNIFVANGQIAGQTNNHVLVHIIPRYSDDGVSFGWNKTDISIDEMKVIASQIAKHIPKEQKDALKNIEKQATSLFYREAERTG